MERQHLDRAQPDAQTQAQAAPVVDGLEPSLDWPPAEATGAAPPPDTAQPRATARLARQATLKHLQRRLGNAQVQRLVAGGFLMRQAEPAAPAAAPSETSLQRHPPGAGVSVDPAAVAQVQAQVGGQPPPAVGPGAGTAPAGPAPAGPAPAGPAPAGPAPAGPAPAGPAPAGPAGSGPAPPAPAPSQAMDLARAQTILQSAYGSSKTIVPGTIIMLDDRAATWAKYDQVARGRTNPYTTPPRPWRDGDAQQYVPGLDGFADNGTVYVNKQTTLVTATAHEMLHNNTAADFRGTAGETINEGATEHFAIQALRAAGVAVPSHAYPGQVAFVQLLIPVVGAATLQSAYFGGAAALVTAFDNIRGPGAFARLKPLAEAQNYTAANAMLAVPPLPARIALVTSYITERPNIAGIEAVCNEVPADIPAIRRGVTAQMSATVNSLLDGWVSDADLNAIEQLYGCVVADKAALRGVIEPRISELTSIGQRTRLRVIVSR